MPFATQRRPDGAPDSVGHRVGTEVLGVATRLRAEALAVGTLERARERRAEVLCVARIEEPACLSFQQQLVGVTTYTVAIAASRLRRWGSVCQHPDGPVR